MNSNLPTNSNIVNKGGKNKNNQDLCQSGTKTSNYGKTTLKQGNKVLSKLSLKKKH